MWLADGLDGLMGWIDGWNWLELAGWICTGRCVFVEIFSQCCATEDAMHFRNCRGRLETNQSEGTLGIGIGEGGDVPLRVQNFVAK